MLDLKHHKIAVNMYNVWRVKDAACLLPDQRAKDGLNQIKSTKRDKICLANTLFNSFCRAVWLYWILLKQMRKDRFAL